MTSPLSGQHRIALGFAIAAFASCMFQESCWAQTTPSVEQIVRELECKAGQDCQPEMRPGRRKRSFHFEEGEEERRKDEAKADEGRLPHTDLEVYFEFNSAEIVDRTARTLDALGAALSTSKLAGGEYSLIGHTDAKGTNDFNQALSERRARAVRDYLISKFLIEPNELLAYGRGETDLKTPHDPFAALNRRVEIITRSVPAASAR